MTDNSCLTWSSTVLYILAVVLSGENKLFTHSTCWIYVLSVLAWIQVCTISTSRGKVHVNAQQLKVHFVPLSCWFTPAVNCFLVTFFLCKTYFLSVTFSLLSWSHFVQSPNTQCPGEQVVTEGLTSVNWTIGIRTSLGQQGRCEDGERGVDIGNYIDYYTLLQNTRGALCMAVCYVFYDV